MSISIGDLSLNIEKSVSDDNVNKDRYDDLSVANAHKLIADLARRLQQAEQKLELKVDNDKILSGILITDETLLISSDQIAVLGQVTFADYVRDQNGTITGGIDPKITRIIGDKIQTGTIYSNNWSTNRGTVLDLDSGNLIIGGSDDPNFTYYSSLNELAIKGKVIISDLTEGSDTGQLVTGTAYWDGGYVADTNFGGSGIIVGTKGIAGLYKDGANPTQMKFAFNATTGDAFFGGTLESANGIFIGSLSAADGTFTGTLSAVDGTFTGTLSAADGSFSGDITGSNGTFNGNVQATGYIMTSGDQDFSFNFYYGATLYNAYGAVFGANTTASEDTANRLSAGIVGKSIGTISSNSTAALAGVVGVGENYTGSDGSTFGVFGLGYDYNSVGTAGVSEEHYGSVGQSFGSQAGVYGVSSSGFGVEGLSVTSGKPGVYGYNVNDYGVMGKGQAGVLGRANSPSSQYGVYSDGILGTSQKLVKTNSATGTITLVGLGTYQYTFA